VPDPSYTIDEFCTAERISRGMYYKLKGAGKGPDEFYWATARASPTELGLGGASDSKARRPPPRPRAASDDPHNLHRHRQGDGAQFPISENAKKNRPMRGSRGGLRTEELAQ
jgi:hypothetical protein